MVVISKLKQNNYDTITTKDKRGKKPKGQRTGNGTR